MKCKPLNQVRKRLLKWGFEHSESFRPDYHYPNENHIFKGNLKKVKDCPEFNHKDLKRPTDLEFFCNRCWDSIQLTQEPFDEIRPCMPKSGMRVVRIKRSYGFADENYRVVIPVKFQRVSRFKDGLAVAAIKKKYGFIDLKGEYVIPPQVDEALPFWEDMASARIGKKWGYIDTSGDFVIKPQFNFAYPFEGDFATVLDARQNYQSVDKKGDVKPNYCKAIGKNGKRCKRVLNSLDDYCTSHGKKIKHFHVFSKYLGLYD